MTWKTDDVEKGHDVYWQIRLYQETAQMIEDLDAITIAKVDGVCTGGGLELTLIGLYWVFSIVHLPNLHRSYLLH